MSGRRRKEMRGLRTKIVKRFEAYRKGKASMAALSAELLISKSTFHRWFTTYETKGIIGLQKTMKPAGGRPTKLSAKQLTELKSLLKMGPKATGVDAAIWTTALIAQFVARRFGVRYHRDSIGYVLKRLGFSVRAQKKS